MFNTNMAIVNLKNKNFFFYFSVVFLKPTMPKFQLYIIQPYLFFYSFKLKTLREFYQINGFNQATNFPTNGFPLENFQ